MEYRAAIIGCGVMAQRGHGPAMRRYANENSDIILAGCCDVNLEDAKKFAQTFGYQKYFTDYKKMLDQEKIDGVILCVPPAITAEIATEIISRKIPVLLEKPPGINLTELKTLIEAQNESNSLVRVAFNRRFMPYIQMLKDELLDKNIKYIHYSFTRVKRADMDFSTTCIHGIDLMKFIIGQEYKNVHFTYQSAAKEYDGVRNILLNCTFDGGAIGTAAFMPMGGSITERIEVSTEHTTYFVNLPIMDGIDAPGSFVKTTENNAYTTVLSADSVGYFTNGFYGENAAFWNIIKNGEACSDIHSAVTSVDIADCIRNGIEVRSY